MKKKMAIIGATGSALKRTIPSLVDSEYCTVQIIQGRDPEKLKEICKTYNINSFYTNIDEMFSNEYFDLIYVATPPFMHFDCISKAIKTNVPIICEKPLDVNYKNGSKIYDILRNYPNPVMIAHHLRHQKAFEDILSIINSGEIGKVTNVYCQWGYKINVNSKNAKWKLNADLGGKGSFSDNGIHILDLIIGLFGKPNGVMGNCFSNSPHTTYTDESAMLTYSNKTIFLNSSQDMDKPGNNLLIYGTKGKIECLNSMGENYINKIFLSTIDEERIMEYEETNLYKSEVENFIKHYILNDKNSNTGTSLEEAMITLKIIDLIRKSSEEKKYYSL